MLTGAVLAGGRSLRYGRNKTLEVFRGRRLVDLAVDALRGLCSPVLLIANDLAPYVEVSGCLIRDIVPYQGPLGGIYTALLFSPHEWVVVRAADMPLFVPEMVNRMVSLSVGADVVVPRSGDKFEPLFALYNRRCIPAVADVLQGSRRNVISFYSKVRVKHFEEDEWRCVDPEGLSFRNVNTPEDWSRL